MILYNLCDCKESIKKITNDLSSISDENKDLYDIKWSIIKLSYEVLDIVDSIEMNKDAFADKIDYLSAQVKTLNKKGN